MYCRKCGRKLEDGEICSCTVAEDQSSERPLESGTSQIDRQGIDGHPDNEARTSDPTVGNMPDTQALVDGAKNAADAIKSNPVVSNVINAFKNGLISPVNSVESSTERRDILWLVLILIEASVISLGCITVSKRAILWLINFSDDSAAVSYSDFNDGLKALGIETSALFFNQFAWAMVCIVSTAAIMAVILAILGQKPEFSVIANTTAAMYVPAAIMTAAAAVLGAVYLPASFLMLAVGVVSVILLGYDALKKLGCSTLLFWLYTAGVIVTAGISVYAGWHFIRDTAQEIFNSTVSELLGYIL